MLRFIFILIAGVVLTVPADARSTTRKETLSAPSGKEVMIWRHGSWSRACKANMPGVSGMKASHGKLRKAQVRMTIDKGPCKGREITAIGIFYISAKGFKGADEVVWLRTVNGDFEKHVHKVNVK